MNKMMNVLKVLGVALLLAVVVGGLVALVALAPVLAMILTVSGVVLVIAHMIADGNGWLK